MTAVPSAPDAAPGGLPPLAPPPHAARRPRTARTAVLVIVLTLIVCGGGGIAGVVALRQLSDLVGPTDFAAGVCVVPATATPRSGAPTPGPSAAPRAATPGNGTADQYSPAACDAADRTGTVIGVVNGDIDAGQSCAPDTDQLIVDEKRHRVICVRITGSAHPSAPGAGGGVFVPGDCAHVKSELFVSAPEEVPCTRPRYEAKVTARVSSHTECTAPATTYHSVSTGRNHVVCLAPGPGVVQPGQCANLGFVIADLAPVPCGTPNAAQKMLGRAPQSNACPRGTTTRVELTMGLGTTRVLCFQDLERTS
jgi:hypothetical protein